ncbi:hypothetical protein BC830DRAFT_1080800 [Chytriomyces sp. MP71]|nr:hypothetical protein BC830DRAFT_1080800 [Chytriomyces sp. MP71]
MTADGVSLVRVLSDAVAADPRVAQCFASVRFVNALLAEADDAYPRGPSKMFFKLFATLRKHPLLHDARSTALSKKDIRMHHQAIFYMEPDNYPCRAFWLDRLYEEASIPGDFWMRGSILRDGNPTVADYTFSEHINGNALYRVDDSAFLEFLSRVSMEMDADTDGKRYLHSYDVAIDLVRRNRTLFDWLEFTKTASKFQFTETIQNWYRTRVNATQLCQENDATYLVHGREVLF